MNILGRLKVQPVNKQVLQSSDFTYLGMFKVPSTSPSPNLDFTYSKGYMTGRRVGGNIRLIFVGSPTQNYYGVIEINYPGYSLDIGTAPNATTQTRWDNVYGGKRNIKSESDCGGVEGQTNGIYYDQATGNLWWGYST